MIFIFPPFAKQQSFSADRFLLRRFFSPTEGGFFSFVFHCYRLFFDMRLSAYALIRNLRNPTANGIFRPAHFVVCRAGHISPIKKGAEKNRLPKKAVAVSIFFTLRNNDYLRVAKYFSRLTVSFQIYLLNHAGSFAVFGGHCHNRLRLVGRKGLS